MRAWYDPDRDATPTSRNEADQLRQRFSSESHSTPNPVKSPWKETLSSSGFITYHDTFLSILGPSPSLEVVLSNPAYPFAHEAGVYIPSTGEVFITSNQHSVNGQRTIQISKIEKVGNHYECHEIHPQIPMANGGVNYRDGILFCAQGTLADPGGLIYMSRRAPYSTETILSNYHGRWFNSVNDVVVHSDGSIWFTDPTYGFEQEFRPEPELPCQVYRYDPGSGTGDLRVVADGFGKPNGICFSPDETTVYITDTNAIKCADGKGIYRPDKQSTMLVNSIMRALSGRVDDLGP